MSTIRPVITHKTVESDLHTSNKNHTHITINNFHRVDNTLMRGAKPTQAQLQELKANGVKTIISFCTNYNPSYKHAPILEPEEAKWAEQLGMKFYWMPFRSKENPPKEYIQTFFNITDEARNYGEKVFIHCRHGADRTGVFAGMYRIMQGMKLSDVIKELMKNGHDANNNPNIIPFLIDFKEKQNFFAKLRNILKVIFHKL